MTVAWSTDVPHTEKIVLLALADNANDEGHCYPSVATLVKKCGLSERAVQGAITRLASSGHLTCHERTGRSTIYKVHPRISCAPAQDAPPQEMRPAPSAPTPAAAALPPPQDVHPTPAAGAPITVIEPSIEPSRNRHARKRAASEPPEFAEIREAYPSRGGGQRWDGAVKAYCKRIEEGHTHAVILDGVRRYASFLRVTGDEGSRFVLQAATFLGDNKCFLESWIPPPTKRELSAIEKVRLANGLRANDERVVSEQNGSSRESLGESFGDVWKSPGTGLRRIGS